MGRINHDALRPAASIGQAGEDTVVDTEPALPDDAVIEGLVGP